jgi:methylase of polypeptide subunit release factors
MTAAQHAIAINGSRGLTMQNVRNFLHMRLEVPLLVRALHLPAGCDVLETGCGAGIGLTAIAATCRPAALTGVDIIRSVRGGVPD